MNGIVFLEEFATQCRIGCTEKERQSTQPILIDIVCGVEFAPALKSDSRKDCVDYCTLRDLAESCATGERIYRLLESLAHDIAQRILRLPNVKSARVTIRKPYKLPGAKNVGIALELSKEEV